MHRLPDTAYLYETEQVCGLDLPLAYSTDFLAKPILVAANTSESAEQVAIVKYQRNGHGSILFHSQHEKIQSQPTSPRYPPLASETYASAEIVRSQGGIVQHCGNCGQCSSLQDISIYDKTRNTLFKNSLHCSSLAVMFGRQAASKCLEHAVGFTEGCNDCWVDNIMCDTRSCLFTCTWTAIVSKIQRRSASDGAPQQLNACLQCDEKRCGPAFLQCAGANRRRAGILSDIRRDSKEVCQVVDKEWWKSDTLQAYYQLTNEGSS